jgi:hypothetical protein
MRGNISSYELAYASRELDQEKPNLSPLWTWLDQVRRRLINYLARGNEPRIYQTSEQGDMHWQVYDPTTHETSLFDSEHDVRQWIENRYYS